MRVSEDQIDEQRIVVLLNGRWCRGAIEADDVEGWVRVLDPLGIPSLQPEDLDEDIAKAKLATDGPTLAGTAEEEQEEVASSGWSEIPTKKVYGKVEFKIPAL